MRNVAVVYHSGTGRTRVIAERVVAGADAVEGVAAALIVVDELPAPGADRKFGGRWSELDAADAIVFGCPTFMGSVSAAMKAFMEHSSSIWYRQGWKDKIAGGFTNSGGLSGDKLNTMTDLVMFAGQHSMIWVTQGIMVDQSGSNRLSSWLGAMSQSDPGKNAEEAPPEADRATAERYGRRIAEATRRWNGEL